MSCDASRQALLQPGVTHQIAAVTPDIPRRIEELRYWRSHCYTAERRCVARWQEEEGKMKQDGVIVAVNQMLAASPVAGVRRSMAREQQ